MKMIEQIEAYKIASQQLSDEAKGRLEGFVRERRAIAGLRTYPNYLVIFRSDDRPSIELSETEALYLATKLNMWL